MNDLVTAMNEPFQSEVQGPGVLIIRLVSLLTTMKGRIQTLEKDAQRSRQSHSEVRGVESANLPAAQTQDASIAQKENSSSKEAQMRQNVIPVFKLQIQSLTSKIQCHELEIKQLILEKEQLARDLINLKHQMLDMIPKSTGKSEEHSEPAAIRKESVAQCASSMTTKRIQSLTRRMQVLEDTVAACKRILEQQQPAHEEYKQKFNELMRASNELNEAVTTISAKRTDEQKLYMSALESINKSERERESLHHCLTQSQCKLTETMQELAFAKEKSASAWNEASKSIFLLDEQSQKIEELSDQMKDLKAYYSMNKQPITATVPLNAIDSDSVVGIDAMVASSSENVLGIDEKVSLAMHTPHIDSAVKLSESQICVASDAELSSAASDPNLASINFATKMLAASTPVILVGQRINSRQAAASRVSFDDPMKNENDTTQVQSLLIENTVDSLTSNGPSTSEHA